jgi:hypothetical protein
VHDEEGEEEKDNAEGYGDGGDDEHEAVQLHAEGGLLCATGCSEIGDLSHDGLVGYADHNAASSALFAEGAEEG